MTGDFSKQIAKAMQEYSDIIEEDIREILTDVGDEAKVRVSDSSPKRTGKYKRNWRVKKTSKKGKFQVEVYNTSYQLTHLLENGHRTRNGSGWVEAQPHIAAVNEWAQEEAESRIEKAVEK